MPRHPPYYSLLLLSASALAYEILLMRLFSIIQWHHFAYLFIGLALLGYGISGAVVTLEQQRLLRHFARWYIGAIVLFGLTSVGCFALAQQLPLNAEALLWDNRQILYLSGVFVLLAVPFFFAASAICLALMAFNRQVPRLYAMDLGGAGLGSVLTIVLLYGFFPQQALILGACMAVIAAAVALLELGLSRWHAAWIGLTLVLFALLVPGNTLSPQLSPYKSLSQLLQVGGTRIVAERSSPLGLLQVVESQRIPLRHAPGLSLNAQLEPLPQLAVFTDGDNMTVLTRVPAARAQTAYLDQMTSALAYHLRDLDRVLVVGAGGGSDVLQAQYHATPRIDAVEINPQMIRLVNEDFGAFTGRLYAQQGVHIYPAEIRDFLSRSPQRYDLIQLALLDAFNASASGLYALNESYLYTVEALQLYLEHLAADGYLSITRWIKLPPRDSLKLVASLREAMQRAGMANPQQRLLLIRSWQTSTLLVKNGEFTAKEIAAVEAFCQQRSFDLGYAPGMHAAQANRYNVLPSPLFYQATTALLGEGRDEFLRQYKFNLQPATDDRPFFHQFFKWSTLGEILQLRGKGGMPLIEWGYLILIVMLLLALFFSVVLILVPVWFLRRSAPAAHVTVRRRYVVLYFFAIGLAFLFNEIAFMQKFIQYLHHPVISVAVTLSAFLVFSGLGSHWSGRLLQRRTHRQVLGLAVSGILLLTGIYLLGLGTIFAFSTGLGGGLKILLAILLIAPLAFCMGMPFPLAFGVLAQHAPAYLPWAWAINGCASVISAVLATILAIHFGFTAVLFLAMLLYAAIVLVFPTPVLRVAASGDKHP